MIRNYLAFRQFFYSVSGKSVFIISHVSATIARAEKKELPRVCDDFIARTYLNHPRLMEKYQVPGTDRGSILGLPADALYDPQALDFCVQDGLRQLIKYPQVYFLGIVENMLRLCLLPMQRSENLTHFFGLVQISPAPLREPFLALLHEKKYFKAAAYIWQRRVQPLPPGLQFFWVWIFIFESALFVFAALGLLRISRFEKKSLAVFFAWSGFLTVCFFFFSSGLYSELRYRFPCEPFFAVLAGYYLSARKDASENF